MERGGGCICADRGRRGQGVDARASGRSNAREAHVCSDSFGLIQAQRSALVFISGLHPRSLPAPALLTLLSIARGDMSARIAAASASASAAAAAADAAAVQSERIKEEKSAVRQDVKTEPAEPAANGSDATTSSDAVAPAASAASSSSTSAAAAAASAVKAEGAVAAAAPATPANEDDDVCCICFSGDIEDDNLIVYCDGTGADGKPCTAIVHQWSVQRADGRARCGRPAKE